MTSAKRTSEVIGFFVSSVIEETGQFLASNSDGVKSVKMDKLSDSRTEEGVREQMRTTYDLQAKSMTTSGLWYIVIAVVPLWPLLDATAANLFCVVYARSSYLMPMLTR